MQTDGQLLQNLEEEGIEDCMLVSLRLSTHISV